MTVNKQITISYTNFLPLILIIGILEIQKLFSALKEVNTQKPVLCGALGGPYTRKMAQELTSLTGVQIFETPAEWTKAAWALNKGREVTHRSNSL